MANRFAGFADNGGVSFEKYTPAISRTEKPGKKKPNSRFAGYRGVDEEEGFIPNLKGMTMTDDINRGPWHSMLDRQALALQAQSGDSYAKCFTQVYEDPANRSIVDLARLDHLSQGHDAIHGTRLSMIPVTKAAPSYDPLQKAAELAEHLGPSHAKLHSMAIDHQRAHPGQSYQSAYGYLYAKPENTALRNAIKAEHLNATMSAHADGGLDKAAPADALQDDADSGSAEYELHRLTVTRMKNNPGMSYQRAFTHEYLAPENRSLKARVTSEGILRMQAMAPAKPFPRYEAPGHAAEASNVGRSGAKPKGWAGG